MSRAVSPCCFSGYWKFDRLRFIQCAFSSPLGKKQIYRMLAASILSLTLCSCSTAKQVALSQPMTQQLHSQLGRSAVAAWHSTSSRGWCRMCGYVRASGAQRNVLGLVSCTMEMETKLSCATQRTWGIRLSVLYVQDYCNLSRLGFLCWSDGALCVQQL